MTAAIHARMGWVRREPSVIALSAAELATHKSQLITNPVLNRFLKELDQMAGVDTYLEVFCCRGGVADVTTCPKYEKLTGHTAWPTCVTLNLGEGMNSGFMPLFAGHTFFKSFQCYVNLTLQRVAEEFARFYEMPKRAESLTLTFTENK